MKALNGNRKLTAVFFENLSFKGTFVVIQSQDDTRQLT